MDGRIMSESEFESTKIGDKVTFYKRPLEHPDSFHNLTELKEYEVIDKHYHDIRGPVLKTLTVSGDDGKPAIGHYSFFLSRDSAAR
jgi:hypothetical protein